MTVEYLSSTPDTAIHRLNQEYIDLWFSCSNEFTLPFFSRCEQTAKEDQLQTLFQQMPRIQTDSAIIEWWSRDKIEPFMPFLRQAMQIVLDLSESESLDIFGEEFKSATFEFVEMAREFDSNLGQSEIFQAVRNLWIVNGLQRMMHEPVKLTPALLAYSLLYPYTDNYVDDPDISKEEKAGFNQRLALRLAGKPVTPNSAHESRIYELIHMIEEQFPRSSFPMVYASIQAIHRAQITSMRLIDPKSSVSFEHILRISLEKGGTSVIADGTLVKGELSAEQIRFLYGYGAYLQFVDDLRDLQHDHQANQLTIFTFDDDLLRRAQMVNHTFVFGAKVMNRMAKTAGAFLPLMQKSINMLLIQSIGLMPEFFTPDTLQKLERHSTCSFAFLREKKKEMLNHVRYSHPSLCSVIDV
ncbi:hypothetical protein GF406_05705 [candidate division KSB1 bacterium]|nr:hypothetical protein [candidate division KSB1 bacterium]